MSSRRGRVAGVEGSSSDLFVCGVNVRRSGTDFVFQDFKQTEEEAAPPHLSYLAVLTEFSCKLLKPDKRAL